MLQTHTADISQFNSGGMSFAKLHCSLSPTFIDLSSQCHEFIFFIIPHTATFKWLNAFCGVPYCTKCKPAAALEASYSFTTLDHWQEL